MNLDFLISKYIDGDLSEHEDRTLREMLKDNDLARSQFETSVDIHLHMKEDAGNIRVPEKLLSSTEDAVLMKILNEQSEDSTSVVSPVRESYAQNYSRYLAAAVVVFFMFTSVINMYEFDFPNPFLSENQSQVQTNKTVPNVSSTKVVETEDNYTVASIGEETHNSKSSNVAISGSQPNTLNDLNITTNNEVFASQLEDIDTFTNNEVILQKSNNGNTLTHSNTFNAMQKTPYSGNNYETNINYLNSNFTLQTNLNEFFNFSRIFITTNSASDFSRIGFDPKDENFISHYSYSLGYSLDETSKFGIEAGYSMYTYQYNVNLNRGNNIDVVAGSVEAPIDDTGGFLPPTVPIERETSIFWGAVFYERNLYNYNRFSVDARLGFGANSFGLLSYTRLSAKYQLFDFLRVNVGLDNRTFKSNPNMQLNNGFLNSTSVIYGLELEL